MTWSPVRHHFRRWQQSSGNSWAMQYLWHTMLNSTCVISRQTSRMPESNTNRAQCVPWRSPGDTSQISSVTTSALSVRTLDSQTLRPTARWATLPSLQKSSSNSCQCLSAKNKKQNKKQKTKQNKKQNKTKTKQKLACKCKMFILFYSSSSSSDDVNSFVNSIFNISGIWSLTISLRFNIEESVFFLFWN